MPPHAARTIRYAGAALVCAPPPALANQRTPADVRRRDAQLLARVAGGDSDAFEAFLERHAGSAYSLAHHICHSREAAHDVCQEAFLSVWRGASRYDPARASAQTWLLAVVRHRAIDSLRRNARHEHRRVDDEGIAERASADECTEEIAARHEEAVVMRSAIAKLPVAQRQVLQLAYYAGLTHSEIADAIGAPLGTVKGRIRLALESLRGQLAGAVARDPQPAGRT